MFKENRDEVLSRLRKKANSGGICLFGERRSLIDFLHYFYPRGSKDERVDVFHFEAEGTLGAIAFVTPSSELMSWLEVAVREMRKEGREVQATWVDLIRFPASGGMVLGTSSDFEDRWSGLNHAFMEIWRLDLSQFFDKYVFLHIEKKED